VYIQRSVTILAQEWYQLKAVSPGTLETISLLISVHTANSHDGTALLGIDHSTCWRRQHIDVLVVIVVLGAIVVVGAATSSQSQDCSWARG
jgi:hypothetical protein